jgi:competence protein ComEC
MTLEFVRILSKHCQIMPGKFEDLKWPALLVRQYLLLVWCAGIFATRFFLPGLFAALVLLLLCLCFKVREINVQLFTVANSDVSIFSNMLFCLLSFCLGFGYAQFREPEKKAVPDWVTEATTPDEQNDLYKKGLGIRAIVTEVNGRNDQRLELILDQARPSASQELQVLPGRLVLTRQDQALFSQTSSPGIMFEQRPIPGQEIELVLKLRKIHGLKNPGLWDIESYWSDREIWHRATLNSVGNRAGPETEREDAEQEYKVDFDLGPAPDNFAALREKLRQRVAEALPKDAGVASELMPGAAFIPALLFGDNYYMNSLDTNLLAVSTLSHSIALSGMHLGYAASLGYLFARLFFHCFPGLGLYLPKRMLSTACAILPALLYIWIGGGPPSLIRAGVMLFFFALLLFMKRPAVLLDGLLLALVLILLAHPQTLFDIRLQLSALAIAAIALIAPGLALADTILNNLYFKQKTMHGKWGKLAKVLLKGMLFISATSFVVQIVLMPVLANAFTGVGAMFPLNLLWLPILGTLVMPLAFLGLLVTALNLTGLAELCFLIASYPCAWLMDLLRYLQGADMLPVVLPGRPHWLFTLGFWLILAILPALALKVLKRGSLRLPLACISLGLVFCLLPFGLRVYEQNQEVLRLRLLDVGQGQAILLECPGGKRLLLDGGGISSPRFDIGKEVITPVLIDNRPARLEYMLASHPDFDHIQGLVYPLEHLQVDYFADNDPLDPQAVAAKGQSAVTYSHLRDILQKKGLARNSLHAGQRVILGPELYLEILNPPLAAMHKVKENDYSLVARLVWRGKNLALLCADAEKRAQRELLKRCDPQDLRAQIMVLPHHGSAGASLKEFYEVVRPEIALASCGYGNRWFFPARQTRKNLADTGIRLLTTAEYGQIIVEWEWNAEETKMSIKTAR